MEGVARNTKEKGAAIIVTGSDQAVDEDRSGVFSQGRQRGMDGNMQTG